MTDPIEPLPPSTVEEDSVSLAPSQEILTRLDRIETEANRQKAHIESAINLHHQILRELEILYPRLERVERKTFSLADTPAQTNCPHCGRKSPNPKATRCTFCMKEMHHR